MSHSLKTVPPEFESLPVEEQICYVQDLWDYITNDSSSIQIPEKHKRILDERMKDYKENPDSGRPWDPLLWPLFAAMWLSDLIRYLLIGLCLWGAGYGLYIIWECSLWCSGTAIASSGVFYALAIISFYLSPILAIIGAVLLFLKRWSGSILLIIAGLAMAYSYGPANTLSILKGALPILIAGIVSLAMKDRSNF